MCVVGGTKILLADGRLHTLAELVVRTEMPIVYSCTPSDRVVMANAVVRPGSTYECVRIRFDNELTLECSLDQQIMLRDGKYVRAAELVVGTSIMPLYTTLDKYGYSLVQQNYSGRWQKVHWLVARSGLLGEIPRFEGQRTVIHHRNFDPADNRPPNLEFMGANDHSSFHRSLVERNEHWQSAEFEARRVAALARKASTPEGHAYFAARGTKNITKYMTERREEFRKAVAANGKRGAPVLVTYNKTEKARARSREAANRLYECETCGERVKSYIGLHNHRRWRHGYNHRVVAVEIVRRQDLVCVSGPTNFAIAAGVFVRACGG